jgi:hypothetical protein
MQFYIQEKRSPRGRYSIKPHPYRTYVEAKAMLDDLDEHGGCGRMRIVNEKLEVIVGEPCELNGERTCKLP